MDEQFKERMIIKKPLRNVLHLKAVSVRRKKGGGAWEANEEYTWSWWLARSEGGEWNLMTWGY